jgi:hypothetical protein
MSLGSDIASWNNQLRGQAVNFFNTGQEVVDYMMPSHRDITTQNRPGTKKTQRIFDSTAPDAIFLLTSFLQGSIFSESSQWFDVKHRIEKLNAMEDVAEFLQAARKTQLLSFRQSNFYAATMEWLMDWVGFGNACLLQERVPKKGKKPGSANLVFTAVGFGSYVFYEGNDKRPEGLIRQVDMTAKECLERWGEKCSDKMKTAARSAKPFQNFRILHAVTPRDTVAYGKLQTAKEMPYASCWIDAESKATLEESGYPEKPFAIARYNVIAGEVMGRGLGEIALPHVKTLNGIIMRGFLELDKALDPPIDTVQNNVIGAYSHTPGAFNVLRRLDGTRIANEATQLRNRNASYEWNVNDLRTQIQDTFLVHQIRELMGVVGGPVREQTAFEAQQKLRLLHLIMAPTGGRLESEGLRDIIDTNFAINYRNNAFPVEIPEILLEAAKQSESGAQLDVTYEGPLAKAQREEEIGAVKEFMNDVAFLAQLLPQVVDIPNGDKIVRKDAEVRGVQHLLNDEKETDELRKLKAQVAQMQEQLMAAESMTQSMKNAAPMVSAVAGAQQNGNGKAAA